MNRKVVLLIGLSISFVAMITFQNCGPTHLAGSKKDLSGGIETLPSPNQSAPINEVVINETGSYGKLVWSDNEKVFDRNGQHRTRLDVDLSNGLMKIEKSIGNYSTSVTESVLSCSLQDARFDNLDHLLKSSRVCRANDAMKAEQVNCLAIAESDIQLIDVSRNEVLQLRPNVCNSGIFLCEGLDQQLRTLLSDLVLNPPASCTAN